MPSHRCRSVVVVLAGAVLLTVAAAGTPVRDTATPADPPAHEETATERAASLDVFPEFEAIRGNVEFWKRVFSEWSMGQVAVHDLEFPGVVYEVVELPGEIEPRYSDEQIEFIEDLNKAWQRRLREIERRVARRQPLDEDDKRLALLLTSAGGSTAVENAHKRVRTQRGLLERFRRGVEIGARYDAVMRRIFRDAGLPEDLAYLPHVESSFQVEARSSAGAVGVWQFTRGTGRLYLTINAAVDQRLDPLAAARGAADYLADAYARLSDWPLALTSYNYGVAGIARAVEKLGRDYERIFLEYDGRRFGFASKNFYAEFLAAREIAANHEAYFPEGLQLETAFDLDPIVLDSRTTPGRLARAYGLEVKELAKLNPAWTRRALRSGLALPEGITVWLPAGTAARLARDGRQPDYTLAGWIDAGGAYVVQPGDTLSMIAETYGVRLSDLRELNGIPPNGSLIRVGQRLRLSQDADEGIHIVRGGDTLSTIARGHKMRVSTLRELNGIPPNENLIVVGQKLRVRGHPAAAVHVVRRGDSLIAIALRHGVKLSDLLGLNQLTEHSIIHPGQRIQIPSRP
jgi:membrane-bound lytic murein transglycosylase D